MSFRRWLDRVVARVLTVVLKLYLATLRIQTIGKDRTAKELSSSATGCVFLAWHDSILLMPLIKWATAFQPICVLISNSKDGDIATEIGKQFSGVDVIRVKHTSRAGALVESCRLLNSRNSLFITPDGPRGPRHQIKAGALFACQQSKSSIIPIVYAASRQYRLSSWDQFRIPLPFSKVFFSFLEPIPYPYEGADLDPFKVEIEQKMISEEERLAELCASGHE